MENFQIFVSGAQGSMEDWREALNAPDEQIPELDPPAKDLARRLEIDEKEYARGVLAGRLSRERNETVARLLGERVDAILLGVGSSYYQLSAVLRNESTQQHWVVRVISPRGITNLEIPPELVPIGNGQSGSDLDSRLRIVVLAGIGRSDLLEATSEQAQ